MTTPLSQMPKPDAGQYKDSRKLFLVPTFLFAPDTPKDGLEVLEKYWQEVRDQIGNLERSLGQVAHVYHETVYFDGDEAMATVEALNPTGSSFIRALAESSATVEATENKDLLEEAMDWQRCLSVGLMSQKVNTLAADGYRDAIQGRYEHIASRIDETLKEGEVGVLFIREDHHVQFPSDIQVFYVSPPGLNDIRRWIEDQFRAATADMERSAQASPDEGAQVDTDGQE